MSRDIWLFLAAERKQVGFNGKHWYLLIHRITHCLIAVSMFLYTPRKRETAYNKLHWES